SSPAHAPPDSGARPARASAVRNTLLVILVLNLLVVVVKIIVGMRTHALSVLGAALESGLDVLNNVLGIVLVGIASRAPDEEHPYGHQKFETLGALAIVGFLSITCFELLREGVRFVLVGDTPRTATIPELALVASTMIVNVLVVWYERRRRGRVAVSHATRVGTGRPVSRHGRGAGDCAERIRNRAPLRPRSGRRTGHRRAGNPPTAECGTGRARCPFGALAGDGVGRPTDRSDHWRRPCDVGGFGTSCCRRSRGETAHGTWGIKRDSP